MILGAFTFKPGWVPTLFLLFGLPLLSALGMWQLDRANEKAGIIAGFEARAQQARIRFDTITGDLAEFRYQAVAVTGTYDVEHQLLLDNRTHNGYAGYQVLTPMNIAGRDERVLINRGWVRAGATRSELPAFDTPDSLVTVLGRIELPPEKIFRLGEQEEPGTEQLKVIQGMDLDYISELINQPLLPVIIQLDPEDSTGFVREWKAVYGIGPDKHRAYALQWFSFALILVVVYIALSVSKTSSEQEL